MQTPGTLPASWSVSCRNWTVCRYRFCERRRVGELQLHEVADELVEQDEARRCFLQDLPEQRVPRGGAAPVGVHHQRPAARLMGELAPEGRDRCTVLLHHGGVAACLLTVEDEHARVLGGAQSAQRVSDGRQCNRLLRAVDEVVEREQGVRLAAAKGGLHFSDGGAASAA